MNSTNHCPIKLRWDKKSDGRESAYLEFYHNGRRRKEFLKLYRGGAIPARESRNNERLAEAILSRRITEYNNGLAGIRTDHSHIYLKDYFHKCADERTSSTRQNWLSCWNHICLFDSHATKMTLADIDSDWCNNFLTYLTNSAKTQARQRGKDTHWGKSRQKKEAEHNISSNTALQMYAKLCACIHEAVKNGILIADPTKGVMKPKKQDSLREYLDVEEVKLLMRTPCDKPVIARAFLFSSMCGLRISDIRKLTWGMVKQFGGYTRIDLTTIKTKGQLYLDIPETAVQFLGEQGEPSDSIFPGIPQSHYLNIALDRWVKSAGITRHITFHCSRHTAACTLLQSGAGIYTVKEILGHTTVETTQIYAKIIDKTRREAVNNLSKLYSDSTDNTRTKTAKNG